MAPEQLQGQDADARSDIFSFGLVLYEMLTGKRAFDGSSPASMIAAILEREAPSVADVAPAALDRVLRRCLAKDPEHRWQSARDLKAEIDWIAGGGAAPEKAALPRADRKRATTWLATGAVAVLGSAFAAGYWLWPGAVAPPMLKFSILGPYDSSFGTWAELSPDGKYVVYSAPQDARPTLWLRPLNSLKARPLVTEATP